MFQYFRIAHGVAPDPGWPYPGRLVFMILTAASKVQGLGFRPGSGSFQAREARLDASATDRKP